jgi:hypothetical protein
MRSIHRRRLINGLGVPQHGTRVAATACERTSRRSISGDAIERFTLRISGGLALANKPEQKRLQARSRLSEDIFVVTCGLPRQLFYINIRGRELFNGTHASKIA